MTVRPHGMLEVWAPHEMAELDTISDELREKIRLEIVPQYPADPYGHRWQERRTAAFWSQFTAEEREELNLACRLECEESASRRVKIEWAKAARKE